MFKIAKISLASLLVASTLFIFSCKKEDRTADNDPTSAQDNALAEGTSNDIVSIASQASEYGQGGNYRLAETDQIMTACATVTFDTAGKKITVAFDGTSICKDGRVRGGTLYFDFSGSTNGAKWYRDPGFNCVVTSQGYTVNGNKVNISNKTITNTTPLDFPVGPTHTPANTNETWHITSNLSIVKVSGGTFTWNCDRTKELLNTSDPNIYRGTAIPINWPMARVGITGSANGTNAKGETYNVVVTSQLVRDFGACGMASHFILGNLTFSPSGKYSRYVDYGYSPNGSGQCDDWVKITINGKIFYKQI